MKPREQYEEEWEGALLGKEQHELFEEVLDELDVFRGREYD